MFRYTRSSIRHCSRRASRPPLPSKFDKYVGRVLGDLDSDEDWRYVKDRYVELQSKNIEPLMGELVLMDSSDPPTVLDNIFKSQEQGHISVHINEGFIGKVTASTVPHIAGLTEGMFCTSSIAGIMEKHIRACIQRSLDGRYGFLFVSSRRMAVFGETIHVVACGYDVVTPWSSGITHCDMRLSSTHFRYLPKTVDRKEMEKGPRKKQKGREKTDPVPYLSFSTKK